MKVLLLTGILWREFIRDKVLWFLAVGGALMVIAALILGEMVVGRPGKAIWDLGLSAINLLSLLVVIIFGVSTASVDLEGRMMQLLLVKPLSRRQYLTAVFFAVQLLVVLTAHIIVFLTWALLGFGTQDLLPLLSAIVWNQLEMAVLSAITVFCAGITSSQLAMFLGFCFYLIGHSLQEALRLVTLNGTVWVRSLVSVFYFLLPNFSYFDHKQAIASGLGLPSFWVFGWTALYAVCCVFVWGWLAFRVFERKEL